MIVTAIPDTGIVSIVKLRLVEYSRILKGGRGIAASAFSFLNLNFFAVRQLAARRRYARGRPARSPSRSPA